jgi:2-dehydropantoate 2-reductase
VRQEEPPLNIAVVGVGCIGSVVASHLARAGHSITLVARGDRLRALQRGGLRVRPHGSGSVEVWPLSTVAEIDHLRDVALVIVATQMHQVESLLPALARQTANVCMLMNVHPLPESWSVLGSRLVLGFPAMLAGYREDVVAYRTLPGWMRFAMINTLGPAPGADSRPAREAVALLHGAGLASTFYADMPGWLATHSALVTGLTAFACGRRRANMSMRMTSADAFTVARALREGLELARASGAKLAPGNIALLRFTPVAAIATTLWSLSRLPLFERAVFDYVDHAEGELCAMYLGLRAGRLPSPNLDQLCRPLDVSSHRGESS